MGIPESIHQLKSSPEIYNWFVGTAIRSINDDLADLLVATKPSKSNLVAQFDTKHADWPKIICTTLENIPFSKDDYTAFNGLADQLDRRVIGGHAIHTTRHHPGRTKFLTAETPIFVASFCIEPLIKSFSYH